MNEFKEIVLYHTKEYPLMEPVDYVKLAYQNEFGPNHMITDCEKAAERIRLEREEIINPENTLYQRIGNSYVRLNLTYSAAKGLTSSAVARIFAASASKSCGTTEEFLRKIEIIRILAEEEKLPFTKMEFDGYFSEYAQTGYPAVSHSTAYREAYKPSYRVIREEYIQALPVICKLTELAGDTEKPMILAAIDGPAASGKTTLAQILASVFECNVFHMDDFFLPKPMRTKERLSEPGGNVHYERFLEEVLIPLRQGKAAEYGVFDCSVMDITGKRTASPKKINIIEGSYSHHPALSEGYDLRIFTDIDKDTQMERILLRNGEEMAERFRSVWIPMENAYFDFYSIKANSDLILGE